MMNRWTRGNLMRALYMSCVLILIMMIVVYGTTRECLTLQFIANEGVMLSSGEVSILIDALFDDSNKNYHAPPADLMEKMIEGEAPFESVSYVLVTHNHPDHFTAGLAIRFLENHPETTFIGPSDAVEALKTAADDWVSLEPRILSYDLDIGKPTRYDRDPVSITAYRTRHSGNREEPMNLVYLLSMNGWNVIHEGDSDGLLETFKNLEIEDVPIDLALVHFWFPFNEWSAQILQDILKPAHIGLIHLPIRLEGDTPTKLEAVRDYYDDIFLLMPDSAPVVFR